MLVRKTHFFSQLKIFNFSFLEISIQILTLTKIKVILKMAHFRINDATYIHKTQVSHIWSLRISFNRINQLLFIFQLLIKCLGVICLFFYIQLFYQQFYPIFFIISQIINVMNLMYFFYYCGCCLGKFSFLRRVVQVS